MDSVLNILFQVFLLIAALSILVLIHELGHFLPAKWFGMRVEKFYLFFDWPRKLWSIKHKDTEYGIGLIPLGGYVKIAGIIDESMDTEFIGKPAEPWEFRAKPVWQRFIVMVGGVTMNLILGILIFSFIKFYYGEAKLPVEGLKNGIEVPKGSITEEMGFKNGDKLLTFNGQPIKYLEDVANPSILLNSNSFFEVIRNDETLKIQVPNDALRKFINKKKENPTLFLPAYKSKVKVLPKTVAEKSGIQTGDEIIQIDTVKIHLFSQIRETLKQYADKEVNIIVKRGEKTIQFKVKLENKPVLGVVPNEELPVERTKYDPISSLKPGTLAAFSTLNDNLKGISKIFKGEADVSKSVAGPLKIGAILGEQVEKIGWLGFWVITGSLSMWLALINILPIPALDGGHVIFLLIEAITGKEPSLKVRMIAQQIGMYLLLGLMIIVLLNDFFN
jgi:regulator of sigma E protease